MTTYLAFNEWTDVDGFPPITTQHSTTALNTWVRAGFRLHTNGTTSIPIGVSLVEGWCHFRYTAASNNGFGNTDYKVSLQDVGGSSLAGVYTKGNNIDSWLSSVFTPEFIFGTGTVTKDVDLHWKIDATLGYIHMYLDGNLVSSFEGDTTTGGLTAIDRIRFRGDLTNAQAQYQYTVSEIIVSDTPTLGARLVSAGFDADGAEIDWLGGFADINAYNTSDTTYISSSTNGEISTFTKPAIAALGADEFIGGVFLNFRLNTEPSSPVNNLSPVVRLSAVNYFETAITPSAAISSARISIPLNPATGLAWELADVNSAELGVRADT
jgi:hypothetical protein